MNWNDWQQRRIKTMSSVPRWLEEAVTKYQHTHGFQSWSAAALEIIACFLNQETDIQFGDAEFEKELMRRFEQWEAEQTSQLPRSVDEYLRHLVAPEPHGGDRKSEDR